MEISYTFENDIMWVAMHGKPGAKEIIKTLHRAFKDRRFIPEVTGIIYNLALFNRQTTYPEKDRKIIASFLIANPINRSAAIVSDPVRCEAANKYREYIAEYGVQHAAFCIPEHAEKFVKGDDTVPQANYDGGGAAGQPGEKEEILKPPYHEYAEKLMASVPETGPG